MNFQLENRVAVVTGGSSGIGFETLKLLLAEGARVAFCGRDPDKLAGAAASLRAEFPQAEMLALRCDVLDAQQVAQFADGDGAFRRRGSAYQQRRSGLRRPF